MSMANVKKKKILKLFEEALILLRKYLRLLKAVSRIFSTANVFGKWTVLPLRTVTIIYCSFKN